MPTPNQINDLVRRASLLRKLKIYINQQLTLEFLLPLDCGLQKNYVYFQWLISQRDQDTMWNAMLTY